MWPPHFHSVSQSHSVTVAPLDEGVELTQLSAARLNRGSARTDATSAQGVDSRCRTRSGGAQGHPLEPLRVSFAGPSASSINSESKFVDGRTWDSYRILAVHFIIYIYISHMYGDKSCLFRQLLPHTLYTFKPPQFYPLKSVRQCSFG